MKKLLVSILCFSLLFFALSGVSHAWQGRMASVGDPYGLIADEADFLIHPAKIANGDGIRFYGDYRFTYNGVTDWDYELKVFTPAGVLNESLSRETSGDEQEHEALLGAAFPLGTGRMGLFFQYSGKSGEYDGDQMDLYFVPPATWCDYYDLQTDLDDFALRLLYGLPLGGLKLGGEVQFAYHQEENKIQYNEFLGAGAYTLWTNYPWGSITGYYLDFFHFMLPYDSQYWEALLKGSIEGAIGPMDVELTLRGGFLFGGDNEYEYEEQTPVGNLVDRFDLDGSVEGWQIGGDLWARYPLAEDLSLPFLLRVDYQDRTRDGDGPGLLGLTGLSYNYENQERNFYIEVGGGLDKELTKGATIAAGIYYNYLQGNDDLRLMEYAFIPRVGSVVNNYDHSDFPASFEHRVMLRLAGELELSPAVTLRMGLVPFYGWVRQDFKFSYANSFIPVINYTYDISLDGSRWGIGGSLGSSVRFNSFTLEPFLNVGYQELNLKGDGDRVVSTGLLIDLFKMDKIRREWFIAGGLSVLFDLP
jgi:hypothetical protein